MKGQKRDRPSISSETTAVPSGDQKDPSAVYTADLGTGMSRVRDAGELYR